MIIIFYKPRDKKQSLEIAHGLIEARLSNSIDELPVVRSFSYSRGKVKEDEEVLLIIKTKALLYTQVENKIKEITNANNPKMYSLPMTQIDEKYRELLRKGVVEV